MITRIYHIVPQDQQWAVKREGSDRASRLVDSQEKAIEYAEALARNQAPSRIVVHGPGGTITHQHSFDTAPSSDERATARSSHQHSVTDSLTSAKGLTLMAAAVGAVAAVGTFWYLSRRDLLPDMPRMPRLPHLSDLTDHLPSRSDLPSKRDITCAAHRWRR